MGVRTVGENKRAVPCLALSMDEAAQALSVSRDFFDHHIRHERQMDGDGHGCRECARE